MAELERRRSEVASRRGQLSADRRALLDGRDLDRAAFGAAVTVVVFGVPDRDLLPGQLFELVIQRWLVLLDDEDEVGEVDAEDDEDGPPTTFPVPNADPALLEFLTAIPDDPATAPILADWLTEQGVSQEEQRRVFNVGIGMCAVVPEADSGAGLMIGRVT